MKIQQQNPYIKEFFQYRDNENLTETINQEQSNKQNQSQIQQQKSTSNSISSQMAAQNHQNEEQNGNSKRQHFDSAPLKSGTNSKCEKQQLYSKAYRQKMKQKYKNLEEQNAYLKKRINELQNQIRHQQLELNRLKQSPSEQTLNIEDFSKQYIEASDKWYQQFEFKSPQYFQQLYLNDKEFHQYLVDFWGEKGFCGKKKLRMLNYHFNQILQSVLKDSQKYLCLVYANSQKYNKITPLPGFQVINKAHMEVYKHEGDLWHKLKQFNVFLHPMSLQLNKHISQFYKKYEDILGCCNKIHEFLRKTYRTNMNVAKRRLEMERWFDFYKYGKVVRKLRYQWFNWMKSLAQKEQQQAKQGKKITKKKKVSL